MPDWSPDPRLQSLVTWAHRMIGRLSADHLFENLRTTSLSPHRSSVSGHASVKEGSPRSQSFAEECWWHKRGMARWEVAQRTSVERCVLISRGELINIQALDLSLAQASPVILDDCASPSWCSDPYLCDFIERSARLFANHDSAKSPRGGDEGIDAIFHLTRPCVAFFRAAAPDKGAPDQQPVLRWVCPLVDAEQKVVPYLTLPSNQQGALKRLMNTCHDVLIEHSDWNANATRATMVFESLLRRSHPELGLVAPLVNPRTAPQVSAAVGQKRSALMVLAFSHAVMTFLLFDEVRALTLMHMLIKADSTFWDLLVKATWHAIHPRAVFLLSVACIIEDNHLLLADVLNRDSYDISARSYYSLHRRFKEMPLHPVTTVSAPVSPTSSVASSTTREGMRLTTSATIPLSSGEIKIEDIIMELKEMGNGLKQMRRISAAPNNGPPPYQRTETMGTFVSLIYVAAEARSPQCFKYLASTFSSCWANLLKSRSLPLRYWSDELPDNSFEDHLLLTDTLDYIGNL